MPSRCLHMQSKFCQQSVGIVDSAVLCDMVSNCGGHSRINFIPAGGPGKESLQLTAHPWKCLMS